MKALLIFNLNIPEEKEKHDAMLKARDMQRALLDIEENLRRKIKYGEHSEEMYDFLCKFSEEFYEILDEIGFKL